MIRAGEFVLLFHSERVNYLIPVAAQGAFSTHKGNIDFAAIQAAEFGDTLRTHLGTPFCLLRPSWADLSKKVRRLTTIIYPKDAGYLLLKTGIAPGARVAECGTGSGAFTVLLANFVRPGGMVYSYDARSEFSDNARANLHRLGLDSPVTFRVADVAVDGFAERDLDAVFLDLAEPWTVIGHAHQALRGGHSLVSISPTIEQIQRTVTTLEETGFVRIETVEILKRTLLVRVGRTRPEERMVSHTVYLVSAQKQNRKGADRGLASGPDELRGDLPR